MLQAAPRPLFNRAETSYHTAFNSLDSAEGSKHSSTQSRLTNRSSNSQSKTLPLDLSGRLRELPADRSSEVKAPGNKATSFFGWKSSSIQDSVASPRSEFSFAEEAPLSRGLEQLKEEDYVDDNDDAMSTLSSSNSLSIGGPEIVAHVDELLLELREVSAELASSIRREMELEDEVDRLKIGGQPIPMDNSRRTSDYYSDSGSGSTRSSSSNDSKIQGLEKMRRKAEQEKAQLRITMAHKVQEDLNQRKALEMHVQSLEEQLSGLDRGLRSSGEHTTGEQDLDTLLEEPRRRLGEERRLRGDLESQLAAVQLETESHLNERDNLRDEVVPRLRSRIEGLESEHAEFQTLVYENTRMQQEIDSLKNENQTLHNARKLQIDSQQQRFKSIIEEDLPPSLPASPLVGTARSNSKVRERASSIVRPKDGTELLPERLKDVEDQRDALHQTLKQLILRLNTQQRDHARQLKVVESERDKALNGTPRRAAFNIEVKSLRLEVNHLRRRADDALEQKWNCEKGLGGLKMDLDRAQQETGSLRELLRDNDVFVPSGTTLKETELDPLEIAYHGLREAHARSIARMEDLIEQGEEVPSSQSGNLEAAKTRMNELRDQVKHQVAANKHLTDRLAQAIDKGEFEQGANAQKIMQLESALRAAEEKVLAAQSHSEEAVARQEEHVKSVHETLSQQVRKGLSAPSPIKLASPTAQWMGLGLVTSPASDLLFGAKSPRLDQTSSGRGLSVAEESKTNMLEERVRDLENAATTAEREMQGVVERMNRAQIEVANLQTERCVVDH